MKTKQKSSGLGFKMTLLAVGCIPMMLGIVILAIVLTSNMKGEIITGIENELQIAAGQVKQFFTAELKEKGTVDYNAYADHEYIESLQGHGVELTLFQGDTRLITSLKKDDGTYNEGTAASPEIYATIHSGKDYHGQNVIIAGHPYYVYYCPVYDGQGSFWGMSFAGVREERVTSAVTSAIVKVVIIAVVMVAIFVVLIFFIGSIIAKALQDAVNSINTLAGGQLNADFSFRSFIREINALIFAGNNLQQELLGSVGGAKNTATTLGGAVANVDTLSETSAEGTNRIAEAIGELATTAQNMAETVQNANMTIIEMGDSIDRISVNVGEMDKSTESSMEANDTAIEYMGKLETASERTARAVGDISEKIAECSDAAEKIKTATVAITEISSQTNLLSLNASIEAARAGEAGRGFAVVASEIQKLAEQSNNSANDIQDVIHEILTKVEECVTKANEMTDVINEQNSFLEDTKEKILLMSDAGKELAEGAVAIDKEARSLADLKEGVLSAISDLSAISEENAASSQEVTSTIDDIASAVESTKDESNTMRQLAEELDAKMSFFQI